MIDLKHKYRQFNYGKWVYLWKETIWKVCRRGKRDKVDLKYDVIFKHLNLGAEWEKWNMSKLRWSCNEENIYTTDFTCLNKFLFSAFKISRR